MIDHTAATGDTRTCVHARIDGSVPIGERVCIFAHFDRSNILRAHTRRYIDALAAEGFSIVVVVNSGALAAESLAHLRRRCARILLRHNRGYDFGAWRDGLHDLNLTPCRHSLVVLANDSVYAPIRPLSVLFSKMDFARADVWSATDSWQHRYHLQSYLIAFGEIALAHPDFLDFWRNVRNVRSKWAAVKYYEIGLTQALQRGGLRCAAVFDYVSLVRRSEDALSTQQLLASPYSLDVLRAGVASHALNAAARRSPLNPTIDLWLLLAEAGSPLLKRELLRENPLRAPDLRAWHQVIEGLAPALYAEVIADLKRILSHAAP